MAEGSLGRCERHQLPLDQHGECQLCRLSVMPSKSPPSKIRRWFVAAAVASVLGGGALALAMSFRFEQVAPKRGVQHRGVTSSSAAALVREPSGTESKPASTTRPLHPPPRPGPKRRVEVAPPPPPPPRQPAQRTITKEDTEIALSQVRIEMYSTQWCGSCRRARDYLNQNDLAYTEYDIDEDEAAKERLGKLNPRTSVPTFQIDDIVQVGFSPDNLEYRINQAVGKRLD